MLRSALALLLLGGWELYELMLRHCYLCSSVGSFRWTVHKASYFIMKNYAFI